VGAATGAPVGAYVVSLSVTADRDTISRHRPAYVEWFSQWCQNSDVVSNMRAS